MTHCLNIMSSILSRMYLQLLACGSCQKNGTSVHHDRVVPAIRNGQITRLSGLLKSKVPPLVFVLHIFIWLSSTCMWVFTLQVSCMLHSRLPSFLRYKVRITLMTNSAGISPLYMKPHFPYLVYLCSQMLWAPGLALLLQ